MPFDWATFGVDLHLEVGGAARRDSLERALREAIRTGQLAPGGRLPSTRALATELGVARGTVSAAYDQLVAEGFLNARTGSGTIVASLAAAGPRASPSTKDQTLPRYDLRPGNPDVTTFPVSAWLRSARRALARAPMAAYAYGDPRGSVGLRAALAEYLGRARGVFADPSRIVITSPPVTRRRCRCWPRWSAARSRPRTRAWRSIGRSSRGASERSCHYRSTSAARSSRGSRRRCAPSC